MSSADSTPPRNDVTTPRWIPTPPHGSPRSATCRRCASAAWPPCAPRIESAPLPDDMPSMAAIRTPRYPGPAAHPMPDPPSDRRFRAPGAGVLPRRRTGHGLQPFLRTTGPLARRGSARHRRRRGLPAGAGVPRRRSSTTPTPRPRGCAQRRRPRHRRGPTRCGRRQRRRLVGRRGRPGRARPRRPADLRPGAAVSGPGSRHGRAVDHRACPTHRCSRRDDIVYMHELADCGTPTATDQYRVPAYAARPVRTSAGDRGDRANAIRSATGANATRRACATPACRPR